MAKEIPKQGAVVSIEQEEIDSLKGWLVGVSLVSALGGTGMIFGSKEVLPMVAGIISAAMGVFGVLRGAGIIKKDDL